VSENLKSKNASLSTSSKFSSETIFDDDIYANVEGHLLVKHKPQIHNTDNGHNPETTKKVTFDEHVTTHIFVVEQTTKFNFLKKKLKTIKGDLWAFATKLTSPFNKQTRNKCQIPAQRRTVSPVCNMVNSYTSKIITPTSPTRNETNDNTERDVHGNYIVNSVNTGSKDDAFVELPCPQASLGKLTLLVDSGADTTLIKPESLLTPLTLNKKDKKFLSGAFGGNTSTLGTIVITPTHIPELKFKMHVVPEGSRLPADGLLGRDELWNRSITDTISKTLTFFEGTKTIATLPLTTADAASRICIAKTVTIPPRSAVVVPVTLSSPDKDVIVHKKEILSGVYVGETLTRIVHGKGFVSILNANTSIVKIPPDFDLEFSNFNDYKVYSDQENVNINAAQKGYDSERYNLLMNTIQLSHDLNYEERNSIENILKEFSDVFRLKGDDLTFTNVLEHEIKTDLGKPPINIRQYRLPEAHKEEIRRQVDKMLNDGIITPSKSPWNSPIILVPKKAGPDGQKKWRLVVDFRKLNDITVKQVFPIPRIDEILDQLGSSRYFSTLDLDSGYHQVLLSKVDREKTAFSTGLGHFEFLRMPFGLTGAPATFQKLMNCILTGLQGVDCFVYLDDIVIYARSLEEHENRLRKVLTVLRANTLKLQTEKCQFLKREIIYLGHKCSEKGVLPDPSKVKCVEDIPPPRNVKELQSVLGFLNYYRKFIKNAAEISLPLNKLLRKEEKFIWTNECQIALDKLKNAVTNPPILQYADFSKPFVLTTDASNEALGAVLSQNHTGKDLPIYYASRVLNDTEKRYSTIEKEMLAIVWAVKIFRCYLLGRHFTIFTDHKPLKGIANLKDQDTRLGRFRLKLLEYDFEIRYKTGKSNLNADALSRIKTTNADISVVTRAQAKRAEESSEAEKTKSATKSKKEGGRKEIEKTGNGATQISDTNDKSIKPTNDTTEATSGVSEDTAVFVTNPEDIKRILKNFHDSPLGGHQGAVKTYFRIRRQFKWTGMQRQIKDYVNACHLCQKNKSSKGSKMPMVITDTPHRPFDKVYMDIVGPLVQSARENKFILTFQDDFSKYLICTAIPDAEATTVARAFFNEIISKFNIPKMLVTDNGTNFTSKLFKETCRILGIKKNTTTPYHPQANGSLERSHRPLAEFLRSFVKEDGTNWDDWLHHAMHVHNNTVHASTKVTPCQALFGFEFDIPVALKRKPDPLYNCDDYSKLLKYQIQRSHELIRENQEKAKAQSKKYYDKNAVQHIYNVGDKVWLKNQTRKHKFSAIWEGPFRVKEVPSPVNVKITIRGKDKVYHNNLVKLYKDNGKY